MTTQTLPTYNGYPNYPTWNVALWYDNDEGSYAHVRALTREAIAENTIDDDEETSTLDRDGAAYDLANALKDWHEEMTPELQGFAADLLGWALAYVDWRHLADNLVDELS